MTRRLRRSVRKLLVWKERSGGSPAASSSRMSGLSKPAEATGGQAACPTDHSYQLLTVTGGEAEYQFSGGLTIPVLVDSSFVRDGKTCVSLMPMPT